MKSKMVYVDGIHCQHCKDDIFDVLMTLNEVDFVEFKEGYIEIILNDDLDDSIINEIIENCGNYKVIKVE